jgi:hypothetical protein
MAVFTDARKFADHVADYGKKIEDTQPRAVKAAADAAAIAIGRAGSAFRIRGRSGSRVSLGAKVSGPYGYAGNHIAYVDAVPKGFWTIIEKGSYKKPGGYDIYPRRVGARAQRNAIRRGKPINTKGAVYGGYGHPARFVHHPGFGSIGHPWEVGVEAASRITEAVYARATLAPVLGFAA